MSVRMDCYCAFCRNPRRVYRKRGVSLFNFIQSLGLALILSYVFWSGWNPKCLLFSVTFLMLTEIAIVLRGRMEVPCPHCGFDPILYLRDQAGACERVKKHIENRQNDPDVWLARRPPLRFSKSKKKSSSTRELVV